jgi:hypothetical protein
MTSPIDWKDRENSARALKAAPGIVGCTQPIAKSWQDVKRKLSLLPLNCARDFKSRQGER